MTMEESAPHKGVTGILSSKKYANAIATASMLAAGYKFIKEKKNVHDEKRKFTAVVSENAYVYRELMVWLDEQVHSRKVELVSRHDGVKSFYDGDSVVSVIIDGYTLQVKIKKPDVMNATVSSMMSPVSSASNKLHFTSKTQGGIDALTAFMDELTKKRNTQNREIYIHNATTNGGWFENDLPKRSIDSVVLPMGVKEDFLADVDTFLGNEARYETMGIPWHRGYLLWGEPGNGKSSLASALANYRGLSLYNLPLSGVKDDKMLGDLVSRIQSNSILLLEDIDIFSKTMGREQADTGPTLAGLLNALDGVSTPHGLITFITTNHKEVLDPALTRPGRVDYTLELKSPDRYQIDTMFNRVYGEPLGVEPKAFASMAELSNVFKSNPNSVEDARLEIKGV